MGLTGTSERAKGQNITKNHDHEPLEAELEMARQMKDGLAAYKRGFSRRLAGYAAIFAVGIAVGAWVFGGLPGHGPKQDWYGKAAAFYATVNSITKIDRSNYPDWLSDVADVEVLASENLSANAFFIRFGSDEVVQVRTGTPNQNLIGQFMRKSENADLSEPVVGLRHGMQAATWTKGGIEHLVIGSIGVDAATIWDIAKMMSER